MNETLPPIPSPSRISSISPSRNAPDPSVFDSFENNEQEYHAQDLELSRAKALVPPISAESHRDAFIAVSLNYISLQQNIANEQALKTVTDRIAKSLDMIPTWNLNLESWTSHKILITMLRTGIDTVVETVGGQAFLILYGESLGLRSDRTQLIQHIYSATTERYRVAMAEQGISDPRFDDVHSPLFTTVANTGMPVLLTHTQLANLTRQGRARIPDGHMPLRNVALLPFGTGADGVLLCMANGTYKRELITHLHRLIRRFFDAVSVSHMRVEQREKEKLEAEVERRVTKLIRKVRMMTQSLSTSTGSYRDRIAELMEEMSRSMDVSVAFVACKDAEKDVASLQKEDTEAVMTISEIRRQASRKAKAKSVTTSSSSRLAVRFQLVELTDPIISEAGADDTDVGPLTHLLCHSPNAKDIMTRAVQEQDVRILRGQDEIGVFEGAMVEPDSVVILVPIYLENVPRGLFVFYGSTKVLTSELVEPLTHFCEDAIRTLIRSSALVQVDFSLVPSFLVDSVRAAHKERVASLVGQTPEKAQARRLEPLFTVMPSQTFPLWVLCCAYAPSNAAAEAVPDSVLPVIRQAVLASVGKGLMGGTDNAFFRIPSAPQYFVYLGGCDPARPVDPQSLVETLITLPHVAHDAVVTVLRGHGITNPEVLDHPITLSFGLITATSPSRLGLVFREEDIAITPCLYGTGFDQLRTVMSLRLSAPMIFDSGAARQIQTLPISGTLTFQHLPDSALRKQIEPSSFFMVFPTRR